MTVGNVRPGDAPLKGIRVVEMGGFIAGPYCGQLLADFGAEVVKIEAPVTGDPMRQWGVHRGPEGESLWWPVIGRGKKSVTIDLRQPEGRDVARRLMLSADVVVENFRPGTLEKWGLDPEALLAERPDLIFARVSGFGQSGPLKSRPGFASVAEAMGGLRVLTGEPDRRPARVGISIGDTLTGIFAAFGVLNALFARETRAERKGQIIDAAIVDSVLGVLESVISEFSVTGKLRERTGSVLPGIAPSNLYPTKDSSWIIIAANADGLFRRLCGVIGKPELADDSRFRDHVSRGQNQKELDDLISDWTRTHSRDAIMTMMEKANVPAGPLYTAADIVAEPHFRERGSIVEGQLESSQSIAMQGVFPKLSETPGEIRWTGPSLGKHTEAVCRELGMTSEAVNELRQRGIL